jgi:hypothetical protein
MGLMPLEGFTDQPFDRQADEVMVAPGVPFEVGLSEILGDMR